MTRKSRINVLLWAALASLLIVNLPHCTTPTAPDESEIADKMTFTSSVVLDHTHNVTILMSEIDFPIPGGITRTSTFGDNHSHKVVMSQSELLLLKTSGRVQIQDIPISGHSHTYTILKWF